MTRSVSLARLALAGLCLFATSACTMWSLQERFEPGPPSVSQPLVERLVVTVGPESRPAGGRSSIGGAFLMLIPLVPYGSQHMSPDFGAMSKTVKTKDYAHEVSDTVIKDLRAAGVSQWIGYQEDVLPLQEAPAPATTLRLTLTQGVFNRNVTAYCLSFAGALLWFVGLPTSYGSAELGIRAELQDAAGQSLGSRDFAERETVIEWLYRPTGPAFTRTMVDVYAKMSPQIRSFVADSLSQGRSAAK